MKKITTLKSLLAATLLLVCGNTVQAQDAALNAVNLPSQCGNPRYPITVFLTNFSSTNQSNINVHYQINNGVIVSETVTDTILAGSFNLFTFNQLADLGSPGNYNIKAWVALAGDVNNSNDTTTTSLNYTSPQVNITSNTFCDTGNTVDLLATGGSNNYIWFSDDSATYTSLDDSLSVTINQADTYSVYFKDSAIDMSFWQVGATTDHESLTGDDRGGIAVTDQYVYFNGDNFCARYTTSLSGGVSLPKRDGIFSDLSTGQLYTLFNTTSGQPVGTSVSYFQVNAIVRMDVDLNFVDTILLSQPIGMAGNHSQPTQAGIYAGEGYVLLYTGTQGNNWYVIDLPSGNVTFINSFLFDTKSGNENWSSWGFSVFEGGAYHAIHTNYPQEIKTINTQNGNSTRVQAFSNLSDMASITYSPWQNRMYFHHEGNSQFGGFNETGGYVDVAQTPTLVEINQPYSGCPSTVIFDISSTFADLGNDTSFCSNTPYLLNAGNFNSFLWSTGETSQTIDVTTTGAYSVLATDEFGCDRTDTVLVTEIDLPVVNLGVDTAFCEGGSLVLDAGVGLQTYQWENGATTQTRTINASGVYSVEVFDGTCTNTDTIVINENANPVIDLGPDQTVTNGTTVTLSVSGSYTSYNWSTNETTSSINFTAYNDTYISLVVTDNNGCQGEDEILISVDSEVGVELFEGINKLALYPNPTSGKSNLAIDMNKAAEIEISISDVTGKLVMVSEFHAVSGTNLIEIPAENWNTGLYLVNISLNGESTIQQKLVKQ